MEKSGFIKILALALALLCALSAFVACKPAENEQPEEKKSITLNGAPIGEYTIVYSEKNPAALEISGKLAESIKEISGDTVVVKTDSAGYESGKEILVGHSSRTMGKKVVVESFFSATSTFARDEMTMAADGEFVFFGGSAGNNAAIEGAVREFIKAIEKGGDITYGAIEKKKMDALSLYKIVTFNDGGNALGNIVRACAFLNELDADIIGLQEVVDSHMSEYKKRLDTAEYAGIFFGGNIQGGHKYDSPILYKKDKFELLDSGIKWLSDTPDEPYSLYYGNYAPQSYIYALFKDKQTGFEFVVVNTHLSYYGNINKIQVPQLLELTEEFRDKHIVYMADWNMMPSSEGFASMLDGGLKDTGTLYGKVISPTQIDFIFTQPGDWIINDYAYLTSHKYSAGGTQPASDHDPVYTELAIFIDK